MNKTTTLNKKIIATRTIATITVVAALAVLTIALHGIPFPQNAYAASIQSASSNSHDTDCLQAGPGNVNHDKNCNQPEDRGTDNSSDG
jgi:hypothetical protein